MRRLGLGQESILEERCLWPAPHMAKGIGDARPPFPFHSGCVCRKGPQVRGLPGNEGRRHFFSPSLTLNTLSLFLCLVSISGHILWFCPMSSCPSLGVGYTRTPPSSCPLVSGLPVYPSLCLSPQDPRRKNQAIFPRIEVKDILPATPDPAP